MEILRRFFFIVLLVGFFAAEAPTAYASITKPMNNRGLVGYWSMEDCRGGKLTDSSGHGNTGTLNNFALTGATSNWVAGRRGTCALGFDGTDDYVQVADSSSFDLRDFTLSAFVKISGSATSDRRIISQQSGLDFWLMEILDNQLSIYSSLDAIYGVAKGPVLNDNQWHHIAITRDTVNDVVIWWVDGVSVGTQATTDNGSYAIAADVFITSYIGTIQFFAGSFDDVRVYNRALTAAEVASLYNTGASKITGSTTRGLVGYWSMDDCRSSIATDSSGRGNAGTLTNFALTGATSNWVSGGSAKRGSCALNFGGTDDYIATATESNFDFDYSQPFTISAWVKPANAASSMTIVNKTSTDTAARGYALLGSSGLLQMSISNNAQSAILIRKRATATWRANVWVHVVGVYTGSGVASGMALYQDGSAIATSTTADALAGNTILNDVNLRIGLDTDGTSAPLNGSLDEVRIYNRALSAPEVAALYTAGATKIGVSTTTLAANTNLTSGLVGHWTFDGPYLTSTTALDSSGSGNTGTLTGVNGLPKPTAGRLAQGMRFDATDDLVTVADSASLKPTIETVSAWVNPRVVNGSQVIVNNGNRNSTWSAYILKFGVCDGGGSDGKISFTVRSANAAGNSTVTQADTPVANTWTHVVGVNDGTTLSLYINGVLNNTGSGLATYAPAGPIRIGSDADVANGNYRFIFNGSLDDVRVYNRALSASEVTQLYNLGR